MPHHPELLINTFALRALRTEADGDYVAARMSFRRHLYTQFFWLALQATEKYLKCILLLNRAKLKRVHDLKELIGRADEVFGQALMRSPTTDEFISEINVDTAIRYGERSWDVTRDMRPEFDQCIWELRRYCQPVRFVENGVVREAKDEVLASVRSSERLSRSRFKLQGGYLESIIDEKKSPARSDLVWRNACFGARQVKPGVYENRHFQISNTPGFTWPELIAAVKPFGIYRDFSG